MGVVTHGMSRTKAYKSWYSMMSRCYNPEHDAYPNYGGRKPSPIEVCERWRDRDTFLEDAKKLENYELFGKVRLTLDRIDPTGNYCPENCRWATDDIQQNNRSDNVYFEWHNKKLSLAQISRDANVEYCYLCRVYEWNKNHKNDMSIEEMVDTAIKNMNTPNLAEIARQNGVKYNRLYHLHITKGIPMKEAIELAR